MTNTTPTLRTERAEAHRMLGRLLELLTRQGRLNLIDLERKLAGTRHSITRRQLHRWLEGTSNPASIDQVEAVAIAAGVDLAFLMPDDPVEYFLTEQTLDVLALEEEPAAASLWDRLAHREEHWPSFDAFEYGLTGRGRAALAGAR